MKHSGKWLITMLIPVLLTGCSGRQVLATLGIGTAVAGGVAAVYYVKGDLEYDIDHNIDRVYGASLSVMDRRGYRVKEDSVSDASGRIDAEIPAQGGEKAHSLTIKLQRKEEYITHISIRVGVFGDEALSRAILDDILSRLR